MALVKEINISIFYLIINHICILDLQYYWKVVYYVNYFPNLLDDVGYAFFYEINVIVI